MSKYTEQPEQAKQELQKIAPLRDNLYDDRLEVESNIEKAYFAKEECENQIADLERRVKAEPFGEPAYHLLCIEGKNEHGSNLTGYVVCDGKYYVTNGYCIVALNQRPEVLEENKESRLSSKNATDMFAQVATSRSKTVGVRDRAAFREITAEVYRDRKPPYPHRIVEVENAHINMRYLEDVWEALEVDENATIYTYLCKAKNRYFNDSYGLVIETQNGVGIILGMSRRKEK